jgi:hypothetical protein
MSIRNIAYCLFTRAAILKLELHLLRDRVTIVILDGVESD